MGSQTLESMLVCTKTQQEKKPRPQPEQALKCPRCDSTNTKFCYYNNYSLSQPRYFCKSCRRYWTKGGTLRNVPVGGGCRKNKRSSSSSKRSQDQPLTANATTPLLSSLPNLAYDSNDLSLAFSRLHRQPTGQLGFDHDHHDQLSMLGNTTNTTTQCDILGNPSVNSSAATPGFLDALRSEYLETAAIGFHNLYYGIASGNMGGPVENCGMGMNVSEAMAAAGTVYEDHTSVPTTPAVTVTAMKQEYCNNAREDDQHRVLWGLPWHLGGDGGGNMGDLDSGREMWNGLSSSWHGLLNSPLV